MQRQEPSSLHSRRHTGKNQGSREVERKILATFTRRTSCAYPKDGIHSRTRCGTTLVLYATTPWNMIGQTREGNKLRPSTRLVSTEPICDALYDRFMGNSVRVDMGSNGRKIQGNIFWSTALIYPLVTAGMESAVWIMILVIRDSILHEFTSSPHLKIECPGSFLQKHQLSSALMRSRESN